MSDEEDQPKTALVGYKRPPVQHRFAKGVSGNPRGRPRKADNVSWKDGASQLDVALLKEMTRPIQVRENDAIVELSVMQAILRSMAVAAVKGNTRAQVALTRMHTAEQDKWVKVLTDLRRADLRYKKGWLTEIEHCRTHGLPVPDPAPHPSEMIILEHEVVYNGPRTLDEKALWDRMLAQRDDHLTEIDRLKALLADAADPDEVADEIAFQQQMADAIDAFFPDAAPRREPGFNLQRYREAQPGYAKMMAKVRKLKTQGR